LKIAVNLSPRQFQEDQDLLNFIEQTLLQTRCNPDWIELEITEGIFIQDFNRTNAILRSLNKMGFTLSLDDFGTGYSSLGQIRQIPVNGIKIDKAFLQDVPECQAANDYVRVIVSIAKTLHLEMIAEGVETKEQADFLIREGCPTVQGFYFGTPITIDQFEERLQNNRFTQFPQPALRSLQGKYPAHSFCPHRETNTCSVIKESAKCLFHGKGNQRRDEPQTENET
jgi:EAL domain-containing protein (putative c-di-GMP-specific phosphodiesterase class I)